MTHFDVEYTDTFAGEANYCWVRRAVISVPENAPQRTIMRKAKQAVGLTGVRGAIDNWGDCLAFKPYRMCTVMFVTWRDTSLDPLEYGG